MKKIAILTSGGDAPGMNACIRALVMAGEDSGMSVYGAVRGYQGVIDNDFVKLGLSDVENIIQLGGTILKTSRCNEFLTPEGFKKAVENIKKNKFDSVVILGGDGSFRGAKELKDANINTIVIPCTIDNDLGYTDYTIGFDSAINTITDLLNNVRETSNAHERVCVVEVMGRECGDIALHSGLAAGAEVVLVPEVKLTDEQFKQKLELSVNRGQKCAIVVVAEGVATAEKIAKKIKKLVGVNAKTLDVSYIQRGGSPSVCDRVLATKMGARAIELVSNKNYGVAIATIGGKITEITIEEAISKKDKFDYDAYKINHSLSI